MQYEVVESSLHNDVWSVEAIDLDGDGEVYAADFKGPKSEQRARAYAAWMNQVNDGNASNVGV